MHGVYRDGPILARDGIGHRPRETLRRARFRAHARASVRDGRAQRLQIRAHGHGDENFPAERVQGVPSASRPPMFSIAFPSAGGLNSANPKAVICGFFGMTPAVSQASAASPRKAAHRPSPSQY